MDGLFLFHRDAHKSVGITRYAAWLISKHEVTKYPIYTPFSMLLNEPVEHCTSSANLLL
ncbi:hypothetical protein GMOD_00005005 [Pyrenophora seminiperda CCB06]|uniref:Uncharacterized protein n=1 Tax=Pyrenophora seminiperda CCB06 TaxID=1302712 RepID=A0A3M7MHX7_9PLEO|nr:hypothetical protein GMOD_00005005 [Pyrenophora seminiperda CCB06]